MVVIAITGEMGSGKTLTMTFMAHYRFKKKGIKVYSNYGYIGRDVFIKKPDMLNEIRDGLVLCDEIWIWLDAREFMKKTNKTLSRILLKSRRHGLDIIYTAQDFSQVDKRLRNVTDIVINPELSYNQTYCIAKCYQRYSGKHLYDIRFKTKPVFKLYDHREELDYLEDGGEDEDVKPKRKKKK
jgi:ABC-type dipeptide/oligopeptide/nickel transport system ATPase component